MNTKKLIDKLGYKDNPAFLRGKELERHHGYSFFLRQARQENRGNLKGCNLKGVYAIKGPPEKKKPASNSLMPVVYVCEAENEAEAEKIHQRVWNQNIVPYLIVVTRKNIRVYPGFEYDRKKSDQQRFLAFAEDVKEILVKLSAFTSEAIDSGAIWEQQKVTTEHRVDRHLLANLEKLSEVLTGKEYELPIEDVHSLIGKYIYLKYLRDRGILSDQRLEDAGVSEEEVYSGNAQKEKLYQLEKYLDDFLNGSVFPLPGQGKYKTEHIRKVAGAFKGDDPAGGQQVLFDFYDFSYVPIETLSVVYQQFLHQRGESLSKGAYYTPVHLVNFILDELDAKKPLKEGMKVFDPSCGSGAFLVQCYRRMVESIVRRKRSKPEPEELSNLLVKHIFGLDADEEACRVAELSLSLTLLDYIEPSDLSTYPNFQLPELHNKNIFYCKGGFFDEGSTWAKTTCKENNETGYDWIVGNPPWKNIDKAEDKGLYDLKAIEWIDDNKKSCPVDNYQTAEAFAWKVTQLLSDDGQCGLLMPAMTLFKTQGDKFRGRFFSNIEVWCIVNFANLRHYLFEGAVNPAAAFFFSGKKEWDKAEHYITTYAPFAVEQSSQLNQKGRSKKLWTVLVNYSAIKEIPLRAVVGGSPIPWKAAMWGTHRDSRLVDIISKRNIKLEKYLGDNNVNIAEGSQLRDLPKFKNQKEEDTFYKKHEYHSKLENKWKIDKDKLKESIRRQKITFEYPKEATIKIKKNEAYLRKRGGKIGLVVSKPPHIIIAASRKYTLYSNDYLWIPARQIGISGESQHDNLLKSLTLYLNSNFFLYQQLLTGEALGVERDCVNLESLKKIPIPFEHLSQNDFLKWSKLYDDIIEANSKESVNRKEEKSNKKDELTLWKEQSNDSKSKLDAPSNLDDLLRQMNDKVYKVLGISIKQRWLIEDMLNVRKKLNQGRIAEEAVKAASREEINKFVSIFQEELDLFLDDTGQRKVHRVKVLYTKSSAVMIVDHLKRSMKTKPEIDEVKDGKIRKQIDDLQERLTERISQWMYYTRCLRIFEGRRTYIFKPRQRLYWLKSQALAEADEFIAEKLGTK